MNTKKIKNMGFYSIFLALSLFSVTGMTYATSNTLPDTNQNSSIVNEEIKAPSLSTITKKIAAFTVSRVVGCVVADFCNSTLLHPLSSRIKNVTCSFCDTVYDHYEAGKSFISSDITTLVPEGIKNTLTLYTNNKVLAPLMIACSFGPLWAPYIGVSTLYPAVMGVGLQILAQR